MLHTDYLSDDKPEGTITHNHCMVIRLMSMHFLRFFAGKPSHSVIYIGALNTRAKVHVSVPTKGHMHDLMSLS